jgi:hypothetical protein
VIGHARLLCPLALPCCKRAADAPISGTHPAKRGKLTLPRRHCYIDHSKTKASVEDSMGQITGFQQFLQILTVPDNIPIIAMMILVMFFTYVALKQARRNDQLIEHGHRERIIDEMRK